MIGTVKIILLSLLLVCNGNILYALGFQLNLNPSQTAPRSLKQHVRSIMSTIDNRRVLPLTMASTASSSTSAAEDPQSSSSSLSSSEWTKKRLHNTPLFRGVSILGAVALAGFSTRSALSSQAVALVHLLSFSTWFGSVVYTTFIAGITMFKNLPRQTFGKLQAKLFPQYFTLGSVTLLLQLITLPVLPVFATIEKSSFPAIGLALSMTLINQFYLEPTSTKNMMRRYELEGQPGGQNSDEYKTLKASFGKFHGLSSLTNLIALCAGVAHAVFISRTLVL